MSDKKKVTPYDVQMQMLNNMYEDSKASSDMQRRQSDLGAETQYTSALGGIAQAAARPAITQSEIMAKVQPQDFSQDVMKQFVEPAKMREQQAVQQYKNLLAKRGGQSELFGMMQKLNQYQAGEGDRELKRKLTKAKIDEMGKPFEQTRKYKETMAIERGKKDVGKVDGKKPLTANMVMKISEGNAIPSMLLDVEKVIEDNKEAFGPMSGRIASISPYNEQAQAINSQMKASSQAFGRFMEGGVLRKEDEIKYEKMFPQISDTAATAKNKLKVVNRLLVKKQDELLSDLEKGGYSTEKLRTGIKVPDLPSVITGGSGADVSTISGIDAQIAEMENKIKAKKLKKLIR